jgi:putative membrane protein
MKAFLSCIAVIALAAVVAGSASAGSRHRVSGLDKVSLKTSAQGDVFEIRGGHIALKKSTNATVRALAQRLITDHTKSLRDAQKLAAKLGVKLENDPTPSEQWELSELSDEWTGKAFDVEYTELEIYDHQQDISETNDEAHMGKNRAVVADAWKELPMLRMHLRLSRQAYAAASAES